MATAEPVPVDPSNTGFTFGSIGFIIFAVLGGGVLGTIITVWSRRGITAAEEESLTVTTANSLLENQAAAIEREMAKNRRMEDQLNQALKDIQDLRREVVDLRDALNQERLDCDRKLKEMQDTIDEMKGTR